MRTMFGRRFGLIAGIGALAVMSAACGSGASGPSGDSEPLRLIASSTPHHEILDYISTNLITREDDLQLEVTDEAEGVSSNQAILDGQTDGSYTQHVPYLEQWLQDARAGAEAIVPVASVHVEPLGLYFNHNGEVQKLEDVTKGTSIAITSDVVNQNRALLLLADKGLIKLPSGFDKTDDSITVKDVRNDSALNVLGLELVEVDYSLTARAVVDRETDLAVVNGNVALQTGLSAETDTIALESAENNPYTNVLTVGEKLKDDRRVVILAKYLQSPQVADWITKKYGSGVLPVHPGVPASGR